MVQRLVVMNVLISLQDPYGPMIGYNEYVCKSPGSLWSSDWL